MSFGKHSITATLCILLLAGTSLSISPSVETAIAASPESRGHAVHISLSHPLLAPETSDVSSTAGQMAWLQTSSFDSIVLLLPSNDKKEKKNKHDEDEGNWDNDGRDQEHDRDGGARGSVSVQAVFGERDRQIIRGYCSQPPSNLPPGLAKRGGRLPPGLEKQLRRNGQLPPGLQKKVERFPKELERRLPPLPGNYVRVFVAGRGLIVDAQFNIIDIVDIFR
jgi:hypothetical protein